MNKKEVREFEQQRNGSQDRRHLGFYRQVDDGADAGTYGDNRERQSKARFMLCAHGSIFTSVTCGACVNSIVIRLRIRAIPAITFGITHCSHSRRRSSKSLVECGVAQKAAASGTEKFPS